MTMSSGPIRSSSMPSKGGPACSPYTVWVRQYEGGWDPIDCQNLDGVMEVLRWMEGAELRVVRNLVVVEADPSTRPLTPLSGISA